VFINIAMSRLTDVNLLIQMGGSDSGIINVTSHDLFVNRNYCNS